MMHGFSCITPTTRPAQTSRHRWTRRGGRSAARAYRARPPPPPSDAATYGRHGGYPRGNTGTGSRCSPNVSCDSWVTGWAVRGFRAAAEGRGVWLSRDISNLSSDGDGRMLGSKGKRREREGRLPRFCFVRPLGSYTLPTLSKKDFSFAAGQHGTCSV